MKKKSRFLAILLSALLTVSLLPSAFAEEEAFDYSAYEKGVTVEKIMEENKTLYKLKELEYLERICEKVGEISVNGNAGIVEQLGRLIATGQAL